MVEVFDDSGVKGRIASLQQLDHVNNYVLVESSTTSEVTLWTGASQVDDDANLYTICKIAQSTRGATLSTLTVQLHAVQLMYNVLMSRYGLVESRARSLIADYDGDNDEATKEIYSKVDTLVGVLKRTIVDPGIFDPRLRGNSCSLWDLYPIKQHSLAKFAQRAHAKALQVEDRVGALKSWLNQTQASLHEIHNKITVMREQLETAVEDDSDVLNNLSLQRYLIVSPVHTLLNEIGRQREHVAGFLTVALHNHKDTVNALRLLRDFPIHYTGMKAESSRRKQWMDDVNCTFGWVNQRISQLYNEEAERRSHWIESVPLELRNRLGELSESNSGRYPKFHVQENAEGAKNLILGDASVATHHPEGVNVSEYEERIQYLENQLYIRDNRHRSTVESMRLSQYEIQQELTATLLQQEQRQQLDQQLKRDTGEAIVASGFSYNDRVVFVKESAHRYVAVCVDKEQQYVLSEQLTRSIGKGNDRPLYLIATLIMAPEKHQAVKGNVYKFPVGTVYWECQASLE